MLNNTTPSRKLLRSFFVRAAQVALLLSGVYDADALAGEPPTKPIKSLRRLDDTIHRFGGYGDNWHMSWADNDKVYVSLCDGTHLPGAEGPKLPFEYNSRMYAIAGDAPNLKFEYLTGYPNLLNEPNRMTSRYYNFGTLALDGKLYQFLSTPNNPFDEPHPKFVGAKLIYSPDDGQTWRNQDGSSPVKWEKWDDRTKKNMAFFEEPNDSFSLISVLQMGQNYSQNKDGFVYLYSPNGSVEGTMNQVALCRVAKDRILDRAAYEFYSGSAADGGAKWSGRVEDRVAVHTFPAGYVNKAVHPYAWQPSVVYLRRPGSI